MSRSVKVSEANCCLRSAERQNKLNSSEYDLTTWAARTWMSFSVQKISVAVQMASTGEIIHALGLAAAGDPRGG